MERIPCDSVTTVTTVTEAHMLTELDRIRISRAAEAGSRRPAQLRHCRVFGIRAFRGASRRQIEAQIDSFSLPTVGSEFLSGQRVDLSAHGPVGEEDQASGGYVET